MTFTAFNIVLDDGTETKPDVGYPISRAPWAVTDSSREIIPQLFSELTNWSGHQREVSTSSEL